MKVWVIARPIEGSWLSGVEYMLDYEKCEYYTFNTEQEAIDVMKKYFSESEIRINDMFVVDVDLEELKILDPEELEEIKNLDEFEVTY